MTLEDVREIYEDICFSEHIDLANDLFTKANRYTFLRTQWLLSDKTARREMDAERTAAHNAFIDSCNIMTRNMEKSSKDGGTWRELIGSDRKDVGDFACMLTCIMGIQAR